MINKNSEVRAQTLKFIERGAANIQIDKLQDLCGQILPELVKVINDISPQVRENAVSCLAIFLKRLGQNQMNPFLREIKYQKLVNIEETADMIDLNTFHQTKNKWNKKYKIAEIESES